MALPSSRPHLAANIPPSNDSTARARPLTAVRHFSFEDGEQNVVGGTAVVIANNAQDFGCDAANADADAEFTWSDTQTAAFLAGAPLTLGWVTTPPHQLDSARVYVCCWVTIND